MGAGRGLILEPFVPTAFEFVEQLLDAAKLRAGEILLDIGSGDGRIVVAAARRGIDATGIELDASLVLIAREWIKSAGVAATIMHADYMAVPWSAFKVLTVSADVAKVLPLIREKFARDRCEGARLVALTGQQEGNAQIEVFRT